MKEAENVVREKRDLSINQMRVELYKLHYFDSLFDLNMKGDSSEFVSTLLKYIHGAFIPAEKRAHCKQNDDELDIPCKDGCFVHKLCHLNLKVNIECKCGSRRQQEYNLNNYLNVINGSEYLDALCGRKDVTQREQGFKSMWEIFEA